MKKYLEPELEIVQFSFEDVLSTSSPKSSNKVVTDEGGGEWSPWV